MHAGADDNASGVAAMLEVAEFLANLKKNGRLNLKHDVIFAAWSGEELGLHGSKHFAKTRIEKKTDPSNREFKPYDGDPHDLNTLLLYHANLLDAFDPNDYSAQQLIMLKSTAEQMQVVSSLLNAPTVAGKNGNDNYKKKADNLMERANKLIEEAETNLRGRVGDNSSKPIAACLNMDMIGRFKDKLVLQGLGSSGDWKRLIERANAPRWFADRTEQRHATSNRCSIVLPSRRANSVSIYWLAH